MADSTTTVFATVQKAFLLCAGMPADTVLAPHIAQQVVADGNWTALAHAINDYLGAQAAAGGAAALVVRMAHQGLGIDIDLAQAASIAAPVVAGTASWADLVLAAANNTQAAYAATLTNRAEAAQAFTDALTAQGKGALYGNLALQGAAEHLLEGVTANTGSIAMASESLVALVSALSPAGVGQVATDGYLSGTTVFVDANGNGRLDPGEYTMTADIGGNVDVPAEAGSGNLVVYGGTDLLTGAPFQGYMSAPPGATVITPLTTIMQALLGGGGAGSTTEAAAMVSAALGLPAGINLLNYDPLAVLADPHATAADKAVALSVEAKAIQVMDLISHTMAGLEAAFGVDAPAAGQLVLGAIGDAFASGAAVDLTDSATLAGIMEDAAAAHLGRTLTSTEQAAVGQVADVTAAANSAADAADSLFALAKVAHVAQEDIVNAIGDAISGGSLGGLVGDFTGGDLQSAINAATVGSLEPGVPLDGHGPGNTEVAPTLTAVSALDGGVRDHTLIITYSKLASAANEADANGDTIAFRIESVTSGTLTEWNGSAWVPATPGVTLLEPGESLRWTAGHSTGSIPAFTVKAWDGMLASTSPVQVTVHVGTGNAPPTLTSGTTANFAENDTAAAYTITSTDPNANDKATYSISGGADASLFHVDASTGEVTFASSPNYESPQDSGGNNVYDIVVKVTDSGGLSATQAVAITVTDVNDAPVVTSSASAGFDENATGTVYTVTSSDQDASDTATYSISGGADAALFNIDASTGAVTFKSSPNFESPQDSGGDNIYDIVVKVTDSGGLGGTEAVAITVADLNETPSITSSASAGFDENASGAAYTATSSDPDANDTATYAISGGADAALFDINASTGVVTFKSSPNFESPQDSGGDNVYDIVVKVTDSGGLSATQAVAITVADINEAPSVTSSASAGFDENATGTVYTVTSSDPDAADTASYSISGGADASLFSIDASTGVVTFKSSPNFESPQDSGGDNTYDIVVKVTDSGSLSATQAVAITVADVNETPSITSSASAGFDENATGTVYTVTSSDPDANDTATYAISGGADAALFNIDASTGAVTFKSSPNFESPQDSGGDNVYDIVVKVSDSGSLSATQAVAITVADINEPPSVTSAATANFAENGTGTAYTVTASDPDAGDTKAYSISGTDASLFDIDSSTGAVTFKSSPNYESPQDSGADNTYDIVVKVTDSGLLSATQAVAITVTNVNDAPKLTSGSSATFAENATGTVYTVKSSDEDVGDTAKYSISGTDASFFSVNQSTGVVTFKSSPNFESPQDSGGDNTYDIVVKVTDSGGLSASQSVAIGVTNVNEPPSITSLGTASFAENGTGAAYTVTSTDPDANETATYSISGGADAALFDINSSTGVVTFKTSPNFEAPTDSNADNAYDITVKVTDAGNLSVTKAVAISVTNVNEAPTITNGSGTVNYAENGTGAAYTVTSTDPDAGDKASYSISGTDATLFSIDSTTGVVTFNSAPNFESPQDSGGDNVYDIVVKVTDKGNLTDTKAVAITVTNVNEAPVITSGTTANFAENGTSAAYTVTSTDPDANETKSYSISGTDASLFSIDTSTGAVTFNSPPNFESPQDSGKNNVYDITVKVTDHGGLTATQAVAITVTDLNEAPTITNASGSANYAENGTGAAYTVTSTDPDAKDKASYSISGTDAALFSIDATTGVVTFNSAPNFENPLDSGKDNTYDIVVKVTDTGNLTDTKAVAITVTNVNEAPVITSGATASFAENDTSAAYTVTATDPDAGDTKTYSISGTDAALFNIDSSTGAVTFKNPPNFENPLDSGTNNVYDVTVKVTDTLGANATQAVAITVTNVNEPPSVTSGASASFAENGTGTAYTVTSSDPDKSDTATYSLGGTDASFFNIVATTGVVTFKSAPNYENPLDSGGDNTYDITVKVTDTAGLSDTKAVAISVTNVNEPPSITSGATANFAENGTGTAYTVTATDPDAGDTKTYSITGTDATLFNIDASTGAVTFKTPPNFENPVDGNKNNVYDITVKVTDSNSASATQAVSITVTDVNEAPAVSSSGSASFAENATGTVYTITATDPDAGDTKTYSISGTDSSLFNVNTSTGVVTFKSSPNYENPQDSGADNTYDIVVKVADTAGLSDTKAVAISVTNVNEPPVITSAATASAPENSAGTVYTATATDPDAGDTKTWSISSGADKTLFNIDASTGAVSFKTAPNFESPTDQGKDNTYDIVVKVADTAGASVTQAVAITVTNVDEVQPTITSGTTATAIKENSGAGQVVYTATATDTGDISAGVTFSLDPSGDYKAFSIDGSTGKVTLTANPDYETQSSYTFTVAASDGVTTPVTKTASLAIINVDEHAPTFTSGTTANVNENVTAGTTVYTATSTDLVDYVSGTTSYSLKAGLADDASSFSINASSGVVTIIASPNYEAKPSYSFTVVATDAAGNASTQAVALGINNLDEVAPTITSSATAAAINENSGAGQVVYTVTSDDSGDVSSGVTYSIKPATGDASAFTINASTGDVKLTANPDYETKSSYSFTVVATDGAGHSAEEAVTLAIKDVSESPTTITLTSSSVNENVVAGTTVATLGTDDNDAGDSWTYTLVTGSGDTDNGSFSIVGNSLTINTSPDYETQPGHSYSIYLQVKDSTGNTFATQKTITVNNLDEVAPSFTSGTTASVNENVAANTTVYTATSTDTVDYVSGSTTYSLKGVNDANSFNIDSSTGAVTIKASPDYETTKTYNFTVIAKDAAGNSTEQGVTLSINDVNEAPVINTAAAINFSGVTFKVTDPDTSPSLSYSSPSGTVGTINNGATTTLSGAQTSLEEGALKITDGTNVVDLSVYVSLGTTGADTQTGSATVATGMWGYGGADTITAGAAGAKMIGGAGNDILTGAAGVDTFYFSADTSASPTTAAANLAANGSDTLKTFTPGSSGDVLAFASTYVNGGLEDDGTAAGAAFSGALTAFAANSNKSTPLGGHVALFNAGNNSIASVDTAAEVATLLNSNDITVAANTHGVVLAGATGTGGGTVYVYYVDNDATATVATSEVTLVGTITLTTGNITSFDAANFAFYT